MGKRLSSLVIGIVLFAFVGCGGGGGSSDDTNTTTDTSSKTAQHIVTTSFEAKGDTFTLHALFTSPDYVAVSSISPTSFDSTVQMFASLSANPKTKVVDGGYSFDMICSYEKILIGSDDYLKMKCDDLNDGSDGTSSRTLSIDDILTADWNEYGKTEHVKFGTLKDIIANAVPADEIEAVQRLSGTYSGIYENTTVEIDFDKNTTLYPTLGCTTKFTITQESETKLKLKEELVDGTCETDSDLYISIDPEDMTKIYFYNAKLNSSRFELHQIAHKDGFTNIKGTADKLLSNSTVYTPTGFEIHTKFQSEGDINLFLDYDAETIYREDTVLAKEVTNVAKDSGFGVDINCTYKYKGRNRYTNHSIYTLLCDDMNSQEDAPLEIDYSIQKPLWLSWSNATSYQTALLNINPNKIGIFDEVAYYQKIRKEEAEQAEAESAAREIAKAEAFKKATDKYNAMSPYIVTSTKVSGAQRLIVDGEYIYVAAGGNGLQILDFFHNLKDDKI